MKKEEIALRTKNKLADSLREHMVRMPFEKITIKSIIEDCNITRPTFYYHFEDIFELWRWTLEIEVINILKKINEEYTWQEGLLFVMRYIKENKDVCLCAHNSLGIDSLERMFYKDSKEIMRKIIEKYLKETPAKEEHINFIISFYTRAFISNILAWMASGMKETPEEMVFFYDMIIHENIKGALKRSAESK